MLRSLPPEGETGRMAEMMRNHRRWVTWMAALLIAAGLVAFPSAGTAFPIRTPEGNPYQFGDPDEPGGGGITGPAPPDLSASLTIWGAKLSLTILPNGSFTPNFFVTVTRVRVHEARPRHE